MTRLSAAAAHIVKVDPAFRRVVETSVTMDVRPPTGSAFESLLSAIVFQQLAGAAARAIHGRLVAALGGEPVVPEAVLAAKPETMRAAGLSANKLAAIIDLAAKFVDGTVPTDDLDELDDAEIVARLVTVRGVGPWTAEMFLLFQLRRPDVWPVDDLGIRNGWARIHEMAAPPTPKALMLLGEILRPYRSTAAWYCWRAVAAVPIIPAAVAATKPPLTARGRRPPSRPKRA
ncbi:MAG TPA: DNA-3-methyladenine glycosylase 2 family protein [Thermoanaerobaculia bacterium]|nr:DNA-3-methyladenine glycosylase 2 family protein [Thermoanaerobaculia bacterium]